MRPMQIDFDPANVDPDGICDNNDSSGSSLTLDGALTSGGTFTSADGLAHQIDIIDTATVDQSGATFTITGTDADGKAQTEDVTGPGSGATVESSKYFLTVTSITIASAAACGTVDVGTVDEVASKTYPLDWRSNSAAVVNTLITGTINYDVQVTYEDPFKASVDGVAPFTAADQEDLNWVNDTAFAAKTAAVTSALSTKGVRAMRIVSNSYTDTAEIQAFVVTPK